MPKVVGSCSPIDFAAFSASLDGQRSHSLCPVHVVHTYVDRWESFMFVFWAGPHRGKPVMKQCLSHWVVQAIALAYSNQGLQPPEGSCAHSTRGLVTSWALFMAVDLQEIFAGASWSSPLTFVLYTRCLPLYVACVVLLP